MIVKIAVLLALFLLGGGGLGLFLLGVWQVRLERRRHEEKLDVQFDFQRLHKQELER